MSHRHAVGTVVFGDRVVRGCSGKQAAFINNLLDEREYEQSIIDGITGGRNITRAEDINIRCASDVITYLLACQRKTSAAPRLASEKQVAFVLSLAAERGITVVTDGLSSEAASQKIEELRSIPKPTTPVDLSPGAYRHNGEVYSVRVGRQSRRLQAYVYSQNQWAYVRNIVPFLSPSERMTLDEAMAFGAQTGQCCVCAAPLTDPESVRRGIGPVCAKKY
jgi:hypothetical protein